MGTIIGTKESKIALDFLKKSKAAFSEKIARNTVKDIGVSECVLDESAGTLRFAITGSVETTSPTGKERTYLYHAKVDVDGKAAKLAALDVAPREE